MTPRAFLLGGVIALALAYATPWNDWAAKNTLIHGSYLPPVLIFGLALFAGFINPRLGARRLVAAELATVLALVLVVGSLASIGLMRHFHAVLIDPSLSMEKAGARERWGRAMLPEEAEDLASQRRQIAAAIIARHDRDGDARLAGAERDQLGLVLARADRDGDGAVNASEIIDGLVAPLGPLVPPIPAHLQALRDPADPARPDSLEQDRIAASFLRGTADRVNAGTIFVLANEAGEERSLHYQDGHAALRLLAEGAAIADPRSDIRAGALLALPIGESIDWDGVHWRLHAVHQPGIPWGPWLTALLGWSPVILVMIAGALAMAAIVRHQWAHNERLTMPIAKVLGSLIGHDEGTRPPILTSRALWITAGIVTVVHSIRLLHHLGWSPITIPLELDLDAFRGVTDLIDRAPDIGYMLKPTLYLTVVAMAFLMTSETSGSMWGSFLVLNVVAAAFIAEGITIESGDLDKGGVGASWVLCLLVIWIGRHHYTAVLAAACGARRSPEAAEAAPWLWVLIGSCVLFVVFLVSAGISLVLGITVTLITFASMLAIARVVAETGTPYASFGVNGRISGIIMSLLGPTCGPAALMPLMMVGHVIGLGDRERLMPHVVHALEIQKRSGRPGGSRLLIGIGVVCLGAALLAFLAMLAIGYRMGAANADGFSAAMWGWSMWRAEAVMDLPQAQRGWNLWWPYLVGAGCFAAIGMMRLRWSWFPLHPIGLVVVGGWVAKMCWASFFVGWMIKLLVLRYGSQALYQRLFPLAMGIILGEALVVTLRMLAGIFMAAAGADPIRFHVLPT